MLTFYLCFTLQHHIRPNQVLITRTKQSRMQALIASQQQEIQTLRDQIVSSFSYLPYMTCLPLRLRVIPKEIGAALRVEPIVGLRAGAYDDDDEETFY